jgi:predicted nucleotidyltransferase
LKENQYHIIDTLKSAKPGLSGQFGLQEIALFGSYARNEQNEESDIDIMVQVNRNSFRNYSALCHKISSLFPDKKVQVVSRKAIRPQYFERLKNDLVYA